MHFVIMGAGRVGRALTRNLVERDHTVTVISNDVPLLQKIMNHESVQKICGFGFDVDTLTRAGARDAFAFAAVTDNDNANIIATRVAREKFGIEKVVARIYNAKRADVFERLGIPTVATIRWTTDQIMRHMIPIGGTNEFLDPSGKVSLLQVDYDESWVTHTIPEIEGLTSAKVAYITRLGDAFIPDNNSILQANDLLHILSPVDSSHEVSQNLAKRYEMAVERYEKLQGHKFDMESLYKTAKPKSNASKKAGDSK